MLQSPETDRGEGGYLALPIGYTLRNGSGKSA